MDLQRGDCLKSSKNRCTRGIDKKRKKRQGKLEQYIHDVSSRNSFGEFRGNFSLLS